jgi:hypothetical protein
LGSDLRVFFDDSCLPPAGPVDDGPSTRSTDLLVNLALKAGTTLFETFGRMIHEAAATKADRSIAMRGGFMFAANGKSVEFNRKVGCIHLVRGALVGGSRDFGIADPKLAEQWRKLGLKQRPSLYALVRMMPTPESPQYLRGELLRFVVTNFERNATKGERDYLLVFEYQQPRPDAYVAQNDDGSFVYNLDTKAFAHGAFKLTRIKENVLLDETSLVGLDTGLLPIMAKGGEKDLGAFNLFVDLIEFKRGDPQLADLAAVLRDPQVVNSAQSAIKRAVDPESAGREDAKADYTAMAAERGVIKTLEEKTRDMRELVSASNAAKDALIDARDELDEAAFAVRRRRDENGWASAERPEEKLAEADELIRQADARIGN